MSEALSCQAVNGLPPLFSRAHAKECGDKRYFTGKPCSRHVDHKTAVINGGSNLPKNLQGACSTCNVRKGKKSPEEFARIMGLLI